ncbi:MAG: hypothetical protein WAM60_19120 [Candidatus Promineifilaceae bacterium]
MHLYLATDNGLIIGQYENGTAQEVSRTLTDYQVTSVIAREGVILAGTTQGVQRSDDGGQSWRAVNQGLALQHVRWLAYHPAVSDLEFAGTEPAGLFVSRDGAESWGGKPEVGRLRDKMEWFLPYSPEAGCVRGFAFQGQRLYAAVEVGGLLVSDDQGQSWSLSSGSDGVPRFGRPQPGFIHPDVHSVAVHPTATDRVYAPTGGGFYLSQDRGHNWELRYDNYCRAVWVDPNDPDHLVLGPASSVERNGRIEETKDAGHSWTPIHNGTEAPWPNDMVERFFPIDGYLFAVLSEGGLLVSEIGKWQWQPVFSSIADIRCLSSMA